MSYYRKCPRCGETTFERLKSYSHCAECLYFEDYWRSPESSVIEAEKTLREIDEKSLQAAIENEAEAIDLAFEEEIEPVVA